MSKPIGMIKLTRLINNAIVNNYDCEKCLWDDECHKIDCRCSVATTLRLLAEGGYLDIKKRKPRKRAKKGGKE
jgi:hypothetical protein